MTVIMLGWVILVFVFGAGIALPAIILWIELKGACVARISCTTPAASEPYDVITSETGAYRTE